MSESNRTLVVTPDPRDFSTIGFRFMFKGRTRFVEAAWSQRAPVVGETVQLQIVTTQDTWTYRDEFHGRVKGVHWTPSWTENDGTLHYPSIECELE